MLIRALALFRARVTCVAIAGSLDDLSQTETVGNLEARDKRQRALH